MKKPVNEYSDEEITKRLAFADRIAANSGQELPPLLEKEKQELLAEQRRRTLGANGDGI
jgi:hypothetical protein